MWSFAGNSGKTFLAHPYSALRSGFLAPSTIIFMHGDSVQRCFMAWRLKAEASDVSSCVRVTRFVVGVSLSTRYRYFITE